MNDQGYLSLRVYIFTLSALSPIIFLILSIAEVNLFYITLAIVLVPLPFVPLTMWAIHISGNSPVNILFGLSKGRPTRELVGGDIKKSLFLKSKGQFQKAIDSIETVLAKDKDNGEALLLKANILLDGFNDTRSAKLCLKQAINVRQEPYSKWSKELLDQIKSRRIMEHEA